MVMPCVEVNVVKTTFSGDQVNFIFLENILRF